MKKLCSKIRSVPGDLARTTLCCLAGVCLAGIETRGILAENNGGKVREIIKAFRRNLFPRSH